MVLIGLSAEEMHLRGSQSSFKQFETLTAEEQYYSIINTFKGYSDTRQVGKWVAEMVGQYGREILPYMNKTLMNADLDHEFRDPINITLELHAYIFRQLISERLLTEEEIQLYIIIIKGKLKEYILKYRVIDGTVNMANRVLSQLDYDFQENE